MASIGANDPGSPDLGPELFVRAHLKAVYDFVRLVYPLADVDRVIDRAFAQAIDHRSVRSSEDQRWLLFGIVRTQILRSHSERWRRRNAEAVRESLRERGSQMTDWHAWGELRRLIDSVAALSVADQEIIRIDMTVEDLSSHALALILHADETRAEMLLATARRAFDDAFTQRAASGGGS